MNIMVVLLLTFLSPKKAYINQKNLTLPDCQVVLYDIYIGSRSLFYCKNGSALDFWGRKCDLDEKIPAH